MTVLDRDLFDEVLAEIGIPAKAVFACYGRYWPGLGVLTNIAEDTIEFVPIKRWPSRPPLVTFTWRYYAPPSDNALTR